jgi:hypothetical protein
VLLFWLVCYREHTYMLPPYFENLFKTPRKSINRLDRKSNNNEDWRWYGCFVLVWMALNSLFFTSDQLSSPIECFSLHFGDFFSEAYELLSKSIKNDFEYVLQMLWSVLLHLAPFGNFIRLVLHQSQTMFEDATRLSPAQVLLNEFKTCYMIDFSGSHEGARIDLKPVIGSAAVFYQPYKNNPSVGAFVMEINGSTIPAVDFTAGLLQQPLSLCFKQAESHTFIDSQMYTVSSLVFRRFHSVKAELRLPSPIVFNKSSVPWVHATHWKATLYSESSLLPGRQRRGSPSCRSNQCRPVRLM